jgi:hypothetical protein
LLTDYLSLCLNHVDLKTKLQKDRTNTFVHSLYMIKRLWYVIFHITCHINHRSILFQGTKDQGLILVEGWYEKMTYHSLFIIYRLWTKVFVRFQYSLYISYFSKNYPEVNSCLILIHFEITFWSFFFQNRHDLNTDLNNLSTKVLLLHFVSEKKTSR